MCSKGVGVRPVQRTGVAALLPSAWEVCGAARVLPADSVICGDLDGLPASDRDYPWALVPSGTRRARVQPESETGSVRFEGVRVRPVHWLTIVSVSQVMLVRLVGHAWGNRSVRCRQPCT